MEIRDPVHGLIKINDEEIPIIKSGFFGRLRNVKQLGFSENIYPGATHTRFLHSLGAMHVGTMAFDKLFPTQGNNLLRLKETFRLACLLHDVGHPPLSHSTELVMPKLKELKIPDQFLKKDENLNRKATHEDYTIKAIADSSFSETFQEVERVFKIDRKTVADLITGIPRNSSYFTVDGIDYFPLLHQLVTGEMDCDRMDYLLRDSYFCGVSYGVFDLDWLLDNLRVCILGKTAYLGISERGLLTFEDFLLSRYHMFIMVYFHYRAVCLEQLLYKYFKTSKGEYSLPADIEEYIEHDDHLLMKVLRKSENPYAKAIIKNNIPPIIFESFNEEQHKKLKTIEQWLIKKKVDYIIGSSESRISKYYTSENPFQSLPIKVVRTLPGNKKTSYFEISKATDLYKKFRKANSIMRLHCYREELKDKDQLELKKLIMDS